MKMIVNPILAGMMEFVRIVSAHLLVIVGMDLLETIVARVGFIVSKDFSFITSGWSFLN